GDLNGDGIPDLIVAAPRRGDPNKGLIYSFLMRNETHQMAFKKIPPEGSGSSRLVKQETFGASLAALGPVTEDGYFSFIAGAPGRLDDAVKGRLYKVTLLNGELDTLHRLEFELDSDTF